MFRFPKTLALVAAGAGLVTSIIGDASACDGKRGGYYRPTVYRPPYTAQCQQPYPYQQQLPPQVQQLLPQGQQVQGLQVQGQQLQGQQITQQGQFVQGQVQGQQVQGQQVQQVQGQQLQGQQITQQGVVQQQGSIQQQGIRQQSVQSGSTANVSAIGALGGASAGSGVQSQAIVNSPAQNGAVPQEGNNAAVANGPANGAPATGGSVATAPANGNAAQAPTTQPEGNAIESALQALMGETAAASQPLSAAPQAAPTGEFSATVTNGTQVRLSLKADGSFVWTATKGDKVSTFQGTFTVNGGSLTLVRGSDNQKLECSLAMNGGGFTLRLAGQNSETLSFVRV